jgi:hypothetical protein
MIGTRHEKAVIVLTSYVIGFTTAFIAFGITNMEHNGDMHHNYSTHKEQNEAHDFKKEHHNISAIGTDDEGLFVTVGGYNRIISGKMPDLEANAIAALEGPGYAYEHHGAVVSNDGWFAFYCEQPTEESKDCLPFVYSLFDDTIHTVVTESGAITLPVDSFTVSWSSDSLLKVNEFASKEEEKPWIVASPNTTEETALLGEAEVVADTPAQQNTTETIENPVVEETTAKITEPELITDPAPEAQADLQVQ